MKYITDYLKKHLLPLIIIAMLGTGTYGLVSDTSFGGRSSPSCTITETTIFPGNDESISAMSTTSQRAWAVIQQPISATNTLTVSFDQDKPAVVTQGFELTIATSVSPVVSTHLFGLNTLFPYTGGVSIIASTGSSTASAIECVY